MARAACCKFVLPFSTATCASVSASQTPKPTHLHHLAWMFEPNETQLIYRSPRHLSGNLLCIVSIRVSITSSRLS